MKSGKFRFHKGDMIGAASAEDDVKFLSECFVDTGDYELLSDSEDLRVIVLGRAGTGKSALLHKIREAKGDHAIYISPESLALAYVSNSTILSYFADLKVNLDPFFKLLWRHVFTVEILKRHFAIASQSKPGLWDRLMARFASDTREDKAMRDAVDYLSKWGKKFWLETEYRIKEITQNLESRLDEEAKATVGISGISLAAGQKSAQALSVSQTAELRSRAQSVVAEAQVQDLHHVMELLDRVLENSSDQYFILVDALDENWVEERLRYRFIMALIHLPLRWSKSNLLELLDKRVSSLVSHRYVSQKVTYKDLLPREFEKKDIADYITEMATTPRDVISLFNECIALATGQSKISATEMRTAVGQYSRGRLRALADEWSADYPALLDFTKIFERRSDTFKLSSIPDSEVEELCLAVSVVGGECNCILRNSAMMVVNCIKSAGEFKTLFAQIMYVIGLVGLKLVPHETAQWAEETGRSVSSAEITPDISVVVHRKYHRALGIH